MVMHLNKPAICSVQIVDDIILERQGGINAVFFNSIRDEWLSRVLEYITRFGSPEFLHEWQIILPRRTTFLNLYLAATEDSVQGQMIDLLRAHDLTLCPACGEAGRPNTLDHYLPKGRYPHFCVTPLNLFPMCDACQLKKLEKTGDATEPRFFIHPYFDIFVKKRVLELRIEPPYDKPTFSLFPSPELSGAETALLVSHVRELAIAERYAHFFRGQHRRLFRLVRGTRASGQDLQSNLTLFRNNCAEPSQNSWEHIFYCAVLSNHNLLDYLENSELPSFL